MPPPAVTLSSLSYNKTSRHTNHGHSILLIRRGTCERVHQTHGLFLFFIFYFFFKKKRGGKPPVYVIRTSTYTMSWDTPSNHRFYCPIVQVWVPMRDTNGEKPAVQIERERL